MSNNDVTTPEQEVNTAPEETVNDNAEATEAEATPEPTVGDLHEEKAEPKDKKTVDNVPIARLNKEIERRKELESKLEKAEEAAKEPMSDDDAKKVDELSDKLAQIEERDAAAQFNVKFQEHLKTALDAAPEYKDVANPDVIRQMVLNPANAQKTYAQLLDEAYGNAVSGRSTIETTTPRGGATDAKLDIERAQKDATYRKEVLANPELKKQYNENLHERINL